MEQSQGRDAELARGQRAPSGPAQPVTCPGLNHSLCACEAVSGLEPVASPGSDASDGSQRKRDHGVGQYTCPVFLSVSRRAPLFSLEECPEGKQRLLASAQLSSWRKTQRFLPLQQCASLGNTEKQRHSCHNCPGNSTFCCVLVSGRYRLDFLKSSCLAQIASSHHLGRLALLQR